MSEFSDILDLLQSMAVILAAVFYVAIVLWTFKDARKRIEDPILVATATAVSMLPIVGVFVYMLLRPSEYIADVRERELEIRMMERELGRQERCPYCKSHIEGDYLSCPVCTTKLRQACRGCDRPLDPRWAMCPFCETEVEGKGRPTPPSDRGGARRSEPRSERSGSSSSSKSGSGSRSSSSNRERSSRSSSSNRPSSSSSKDRSSAPKSTGTLTTEPFDADK
jgi:hypothetical protein